LVHTPLLPDIVNSVLMPYLDDMHIDVHNRCRWTTPSEDAYNLRQEEEDRQARETTWKKNESNCGRDGPSSAPF
jgi:hypothetical protein